MFVTQDSLCLFVALKPALPLGQLALLLLQNPLPASQVVQLGGEGLEDGGLEGGGMEDEGQLVPGGQLTFSAAVPARTWSGMEISGHLQEEE